MCNSHSRTLTSHGDFFISSAFNRIFDRTMLGVCAWVFCTKMTWKRVWNLSAAARDFSIDHFLSLWVCCVCVREREFSTLLQSTELYSSGFFVNDPQNDAVRYFFLILERKKSPLLCALFQAVLRLCPNLKVLVCAWLLVIPLLLNQLRNLVYLVKIDKYFLVTYNNFVYWELKTGVFYRKVKQFV